jgi:secreted PhoX family phosphatase
MAKRAHYEEDPVIRSDGGVGDYFGRIVGRRFSRRALIHSAAVAAATAAVTRGRAVPGPAADLGFRPIQATKADEFIVPEGFEAKPLLKWGDPIDPAAGPAWTGGLMKAQAQSQTFGYNCDYIGFVPLEEKDGRIVRGILGVNHEYPNPEIMWPKPGPEGRDRDQLEAIVESVGFSVVEIEMGEDGFWKPVPGSKLSRRVSLSTPHEITGPARGATLMRTKAHPDGATAIGTTSNCAGGTTPWGTFLSGEENFQDWFGNAEAVTDPKVKASHGRYGVAKKKSDYELENFEPRFDCAHEPNEPFHHGWVVEINPFDPNSKPKKRTALGRFRHEGATTWVTGESRLVLYSGCDARFEYVYKYVASKAYTPDVPRENDLLDDGILYVARFDEDGTGQWLPLVFGAGPLTAENGFEDQGDVLVRTREAADLLGATKMDRPEDIEVNPVNKKVYVVCTNNSDRGAAGKPEPDASNPRTQNKHGHIIELTEAGDDHAATKFAWELFLVCGNPEDESTYFAGYDKSDVAAISCPDNVCFDQAGNLWIATDGQPRAIEVNDGLYAVPVEGPERGRLRQFLSVPRGAECAGPCFTDDFRTLFVAVQHPGEGGSYEALTSHWPDGTGVPRPTVMQVRAKDSSAIGGKPGASRRDALRGLAAMLRP